MPPRKQPTVETIVEPLDEPIIDPDVSPEERPETIQPEDTVTFKRSHFYAVLTVLAFAAGILLGYVAWGMEPETQAAQAVDPPAAAVLDAPPTEAPQFQRYNIPVNDSYALGPTDAPITIVEFSDYQCPFCRRWHDEVYEPLLAAYPGKIKFVYRHLPLTSIHPDAFPAAEAAMCAGEQDSYWQFHEKLFSTESLGRNNFVQYARDLGLDVQAFEACVDERKYQEQVQADVDFAVDLGVRSTPTFFINGLAIVGAQPLEVFQQVIDKELAGEIPK
jgi:protein-disulfide isomerase